MGRIDRRSFLQGTAALAAGCAATGGAAPARAAEYGSRWAETPDRVWPGPETWTNPLQDWRVAGGRLETTNPAPDRNVHLLTREVGAKEGELRLSVRVGRVAGGPLAQGGGSAGFRVGVQGPLREYRNNAIFGKGLDAGIAAGGGLFIGTPEAGDGSVGPEAQAVELRFEAGVQGATLSAHDPATGKLLGRAVRAKLAPERLAGNLCLVSNYGAAGPRAKAGDRFWFSDWAVSGSRVEAREERAFGPVLFSHYTLSRGVLKLSAQMPPLGPDDSPTVRLQVKRDGAWTTLAEERIHPEARIAAFKVGDWDASRDVPYRLAYALAWKGGKSEERSWEGVVRRDPVDKPVLTVADVSCNIHAAFPNADLVANMARLDPDLLAFTGDQFYESTGGYGTQRAPLGPSFIDYLRKWYLHGWTWRELTKDRPSLSIPDDHDVYQGNHWGEGGAARKTTQEAGGYEMPAAWLNVVHRTQTAHHPDPFDPAPAKQGLLQYYGDLLYGRVSFAVLADRMYKSGPDGKVPPTGRRGDHVTDPNYDPKTADLPGLELLGEGQMKFLRQWAVDWKGALMKAVVSQTIFTAVATTHGGERQRLRADYDANGWPQTARNAALREIRKAFAVHLAGDQHLPAVVHYGIEAHRDAGVAFAGPAVNVGYPRWFEPEKPGANRPAGAPGFLGDFTDSFGHPLTVLALANGAVQPRRPLLENLHDKTSGIGLVRFDKAARKVTFECWPLLADPLRPGTQMPGWPVTVELAENYGRARAGHLPRLEIAGTSDPLVQVVEEATGELLYGIRPAAGPFRPFVFKPGKHAVRVSDPETGRSRELAGLEPAADGAPAIEVRL